MKYTTAVVVPLVFAALSGGAFAVQPSVGQNQLALSVSMKGEITVDSTRLTFKELSEKVKTALVATPDLVIVIKAEKETPLEVMTKVFEACRRVGATKFTMASNKNRDGSKPSTTDAP